MVTSNGQIGEVLEGLVEARNDRGIRVAGEWRNLSKFHPLELPGQGARVRCELDSKGFLRSVQVLDAAPSTSSPPRSHHHAPRRVESRQQLPWSVGANPRGKSAASMSWCWRTSGSPGLTGRMK